MLFRSHHTDGQLVGYPGGEYLPSYRDIQDFSNAIGEYDDTQRRGDRHDFVSFWERSESDYVSAYLLYINNDTNVTFGRRMKGTKWQPLTNVVHAISCSQNGATNVIAPGSFPYTGVTRIDKPLRIVKSADTGVARITN